MKMILGFAGKSISSGCVTNRTTRLNTILTKNEEKKGSGIEYCRDLFRMNLEGVIGVLKWMHKNNLHFFRINSDLAPHITNPSLLSSKKKSDPTALVYSLQPFSGLLRDIGDIARKWKIRLTFHPDLWNVVNAIDPDIVLRTTRELFFHAQLLELMNPEGIDPVIVVHGGGIYGDKKAAMNRFIQNVYRMPDVIRKYLVLENDEHSYNIEDVLYLANQCGIPVVFDLFHHKIYRSHHPEIKPFIHYYEDIARTWTRGRKMKIHISEQKPDAVEGTHADYVKSIPRELIGKRIYIMIEAGYKDLAVIYLNKKYKL